MGASDAERAQALANQANIAMNTETNETNRDIAESANAWNYLMFHEQNDWNLARRDEEWAYNDPSAQMQRFIQAGINPLWAMSSSDAGRAQQLTSADAKPAEVPTMTPGHVEPEYDPFEGAKLGNITTAAQNVVNSAQGFYKLSLESQDVSTRQKAQESQARLNEAEAAFKKASTVGQDIFNNLNSKTFDTQVSSRVADYWRLRKEIDNQDMDIKVKDATIRNLNATRDQIAAQTNYVQMQTDHYIEQIAQRWKEITIMGRNADINQQNADTASAAQETNQQRLDLERSRFNVDVHRIERDFQVKSNEQILQYLNNKRGFIDRWLGTYGYAIEDAVTLGRSSVLEQRRFDVLSAEMQSAGLVLKDRFIKDPTDANKDAYNSYLDFINSLPEPKMPVLPYGSTPSNSSVLNPSDSWQQ